MKLMQGKIMKSHKALIKKLINEAIVYQWPSPEELSIMREIAKKRTALIRLNRFRVKEDDEIKFVTKMIKFYLENGNDINSVIERFDFEISGNSKPTLGNNWNETGEDFEEESSSED